MGEGYHHPNRIAGFYEDIVETRRRMFEEFLESDRLLQEFTDAAIDFTSGSEHSECGQEDASFDESPVFERLIAILVSRGLDQGATSIGFSPSLGGVRVYLELPDRCDVVDSIARSGYEGLIRWIQGNSTNDRIAVRMSDRHVTLTIQREECAMGTRVVLRVLD